MKSFYSAVFLLFVLCSCGVADRRNDVYFNTPIEAIDAAFNKYSRLSIRYDKEYGGIIYKDQAGFFYTYASGLPSSGALTFANKKFTGSSVAMWHTHGNSDSGFSDQDRVTADRQCIDSYMMNKTDELFLYKGCKL